MSEALRPATHARHYAEPPQKTESDGTRHWITRAANFVTVVSQAPEGAVLERDNPDEYMVLLPPETQATIEANGQQVESNGNSLTIVPPGESRTFEVGCGDVTTYAGMIREYARQRGLRRWLISVPVLTPKSGGIVRLGRGLRPLGGRPALGLRLAALEILPQRRAQAPLLPRLLRALRRFGHG